MKDRVPLIIGDNLHLLTMISCDRLRVRMQKVNFVIDTGSPDSFLSPMDISKLQISLAGKKSTSPVKLGGSQYNAIPLPDFKFYMLKDDKSIFTEENIKIYGLQPVTTSLEKLQSSQTLPSILGMNFLRNQKFSLHVILTENIAFLEDEE